MTTLATTHGAARTGETTAIGRVARTIADVATGLVRRWQINAERRRALAHLRDLDDRLLEDIGISRGSVLAQLHEAERTFPQSAFHLAAVYGLKAANQDRRSRNAA